jgi:formamidopyrimidine-DNA glycosylase
VPELPDVTVYCERLAAKTVGSKLTGVRLRSTFLLRTAVPPLSGAFGREVVAVRRLGKRIVIELSEQWFLVVHLMIAGRLRWGAVGAAVPARDGLAAFDFEGGTVLFTEASPKKRASLHVVQGEQGLEAFDRGGLPPIGAGFDQVKAALHGENHTLKRSLTDPRLFDGIGGAYGDEILFRARLSPVQWSKNLGDDEIERLRVAMHSVLSEWTERFREQVGQGFPDKVTAFQPEMAVHGKFGQPCPVCASPVQRIVYVGRETNYCATCQTEGKVLRDRALSQLLRGDWPSTLEELEALRRSESGDRSG